MKTLLFDETASETNNNFHKGFNVTVRLGSKYVKTLEIGETLELKNLQGETLGTARIEQMVVGPIKYIPEIILKFEHDPKCREVNGLIEVLQNCYHSAEIDMNEIVTAIVFFADWERN
jgi:hypothetical protein